MAKPILPDTDILIDFLRGYCKAVNFVNTFAARIMLSSIVVAELYAGVKGEREQSTLDSFISLFHIIPPGAEVAKIAGLYKRDYGRSHGIGLADAILAATAEAENLELKTLNIRHYPMFRNLRPAYKK
jgi:predicted nucleic acid-binding protein